MSALRQDTLKEPPRSRVGITTGYVVALARPALGRRTKRAASSARRMIFRLPLRTRRSTPADPIGALVCANRGSVIKPAAGPPRLRSPSSR